MRTNRAINGFPFACLIALIVSACSPAVTEFIEPEHQSGTEVDHLDHSLKQIVVRAKSGYASGFEVVWSNHVAVTDFTPAPAQNETMTAPIRDCIDGPGELQLRSNAQADAEHTVHIWGGPLEAASTFVKFTLPELEGLPPLIWMHRGGVESIRLSLHSNEPGPLPITITQMGIGLQLNSGPPGAPLTAQLQTDGTPLLVVVTAPSQIPAPTRQSATLTIRVPGIRCQQLVGGVY